MTLRDAMLIVLELAGQNAIDEREDPREAKRQYKALRMVSKLRQAMTPCESDEYKTE